MLNARAAVVLALLTAMLGACGGESRPALQPPVRGSTPAPGDTRLFYKVRLKMEARGTDAFTLDTETLLDVHEISGGRNPVAVWFLTVSVGDKLTTPDGRFLSFSADLAPGIYRGPGTYTIDGKTQGKVLGVETNIGSAAFVALADPTARPPRLARYGMLVQPCTLTFAEEARTGSVSCPALGNDTDPKQRIALEWSWSRL